MEHVVVGVIKLGEKIEQFCRVVFLIRISLFCDYITLQDWFIVVHKIRIVKMSRPRQNPVKIRLNSGIRHRIRSEGMWLTWSICHPCLHGVSLRYESLQSEHETRFLRMIINFNTHKEAVSGSHFLLSQADFRSALMLRSLKQELRDSKTGAKLILTADFHVAEGWRLRHGGFTALCKRRGSGPARHLLTTLPFFSSPCSSFLMTVEFFKPKRTLSAQWLRLVLVHGSVVLS